MLLHSRVLVVIAVIMEVLVQETLEQLRKVSTVMCQAVPVEEVVELVRHRHMQLEVEVLLEVPEVAAARAFL